MTFNTNDRNDLGMLTLVACDQAYAGNAAQNKMLAAFPDSEPGVQNSPNFSVAGSGFTVVDTWEDSSTGFKCLIYKNETTNELMLAMAGTDGPNVKDWGANAFHYGWNQWDENRSEVVARLVAAGYPNCRKLHITGQSLGGALAEYALYDLTATISEEEQRQRWNFIRPDIDPGKVTITTYNGLGGYAGLQAFYGDNFLSQQANTDGAHSAHYTVNNDLVHRLGTLHLGAEVYQFRLYDKNHPSPAGGLFEYNLVTAHRIETALYPNLNATSFTQASRRQDYGPLQITNLQKQLSRFGNPLSSTSMSSGEIIVGMISAALPAFATSPDEEVNQLVWGLFETRYRAGETSNESWQKIRSVDWGKTVTAWSVVSTVVLGPLSLITTWAGAIVLGKLLTALDTTLGQAQSAIKKLTGQEGNIVGAEAHSDSRRNAEFEILRAAIDPGSGSVLNKCFQCANFSIETFAEKLESGEHWASEAAKYAASVASASTFPGIEKASILGQIGTEILARANTASRKDSGFIAGVVEDLLPFISDASAAIRLANSDYTKSEISSINLAKASSWDEFKTYTDSFLSGLAAAGDNIASLAIGIGNAKADELSGRLSTIARDTQASAQTVILKTAKGNPFADGASIDPDGTGSSDITEGHLQSFTLYLPYAAGEEGQKVKLTLAGTNADAFTLIYQGKRIDLGADGAFQVTVKAGEQNIAFGLWAMDDVDADGTLTVKAQLLDAEGNPTHKEHTELTLALEAEDESNSSYARTIVGDFDPIDFDPAKEGIQPHYDDLGNYLVEGDRPGYSDYLQDSADNDLLQGLEGDDVLSAWRGGDDTLEGGSGSDLLYAAAGNDLLFADARQERQQALEANDAGTGSSAIRGDWLDGVDGEDFIVGGSDADVLMGGSDEDLLIGGAGNDNLWGDTTANAVWGDWTLTRQVEEQGGITHYRSIFTRADILTATGSDDLMFGGAGDDWLVGDGGDDFIDGGADNDVAFGSQGDDQLLGSAGNDVLSGDELDDPANPGTGLAGALHGNDFLDGGDGDDDLTGNGGNDELFGGDGNDELDGDDTKTPGEYHGKDSLSGGSGNDRLWGNGNDDELIGGDGNDHIEGDYSGLDTQYHGKDILSGGAGNDELIGGGDDDELYGGADDDVLVGDDTPDSTFAADAHGDDMLDGGDGDDDLSGGGGDDKLYGGKGDDELIGDGDTVAEGGKDLLDGGDGNDLLAGNGGDDRLLGGVGEDSLSGGDGDDTLIGGAGADAMDGGDGDDIYIFTAGDSHADANGMNEAIVDQVGANTVVFESATSGDLALYSANNGEFLVIDYSVEDRLVIQGGFQGAVASYQFADGERLSYSELIGRMMEGVWYGATGSGGVSAVGGTGSDQILATEGGATFSGGRGNDTVVGNGGGNTYLYSLGDGTDTITDTSKASGFNAANTLRFGSGIRTQDIKLGLGSLLISVGNNPADAIHIDGFDRNDVMAQHPIDRFEFSDGTVLTYEQLVARGFDLEGTNGNDTISGTNVSDRIKGGAGDDVLTGGEGSDTYYWGLGAGQDVIDNTDSASTNADVLQIGAGLWPEDLAFVRSINDLIIRARSSNDQVTVVNHFSGAEIGTVAFSDGRVWGQTEISANLTNELTSGADIYSGTAGDDSINGLGGNDTLWGLAGNDLLIGGDGADSLKGGAGSDTLDGRSDSASDSMEGGGRWRYLSVWKR